MSTRRRAGPAHWQRAVDVPHAGVALVVQRVVREVVLFDVVPAVAELPVRQRVYLNHVAVLEQLSADGRAWYEVSGRNGADD